MIIALVTLAWAGPAVEASAFAGGRSAPESSIQLPARWEGEVEPAGLVGLDGALRWAAPGGGWLRTAVGAWAYAPELEPDVLTAEVGAGWTRARDHAALAVAGRYDVEAYPWLPDASNGRAELVASAQRVGDALSVGARLEAVDRRFVGAAGLSAAELGGRLAWRRGVVGLDVGLAAQGNAAPTGAIGAQGRTLLRVGLAGPGWSVGAEHRFAYAVGGDVEEETRAAFTPVGGYAADVDALSGGGFVQHRFGLDAAVTAGRWTAAAGGFARFRTAADEDEAAVAFATTWSGQARVACRLGQAAPPPEATTVDLFVLGGASAARFVGGGGYLDGFGWGGVDVRVPARSRRD